MADKDKKRIMELEQKLAIAQMEIKNCHILLAIVASRGNGLVITDQEMQAAGDLGVLHFMRDDRIPGCTVLLKPAVQ